MRPWWVTGSVGGRRNFCLCDILLRMRECSGERAYGCSRTRKQHVMMDVIFVCLASISEARKRFAGRMEQVHSAFLNPVSVSRARALTRVTIDMGQLEFVALGVLKTLDDMVFFRSGGIS